MYNYDDINTLDALYKAADIHKKVRQFIKPYLIPGIKLVNVAQLIEYKTRQLTEELSNSNNNYKSINYGIGFPACLSLNNVAAHYHPNANSQEIYKYGDVFKIDFGTEVNGWIIDSAFTITENHIYDNLLSSVKDGVYQGIEEARYDVRINEWGENLQEIVESYETEYNGNTYPIKVITNLSGHSINKNGVLHGDIRLSPFKTNENLGTIKKDVYAIEILASTSLDPKYKNNNNNMVTNSMDDDIVTLYSLNSKNPINKSNPFYKRFGYLPFTNRYLTDYGLFKLNNIDKSYVNYHNSLVMPKSYMVSHFEHTLFIDENKKIVFSKGEDY